MCPMEFDFFAEYENISILNSVQIYEYCLRDDRDGKNGDL